MGNPEFIDLVIMSDFWRFTSKNQTNMNKFEHKWIMYHEIHQQNRNGKKPSQIASFLGIDKRTVKKYLAMSEQEYLEFQDHLSGRFKKLTDYEDFVRERLEQCTGASAAQVYDWLKECHPDFIDISQRTVYNFVLQVRKKHQLPKVFTGREYCKVQDLPYGRQAQVDFGEFNMTNSDSQRKKVYFFAMVLSRSRYKYVLFSENPFTSDSAIDAHEQAFLFMRGYPEEIVYDQDKVLLVNENKGDLLLTEAFRMYHQSRCFHLHFCRKSDPQSKGKVENVIKYIKYNFLRGRTYFDKHTINAQVLEWLDRTANAKVHATTRLVPTLEWNIEKTHLKPLREPFVHREDKAPYKVRKDNTISFKGNLYTLPVGTYKGADTGVFVIQENDTLVIHNVEGQEIARHKIAHLKGKLVFNNNHYRDSSVAIDDLIKQVVGRFTDTIKATLYLEKLKLKNPRYVRDQVKIIQAVREKYSQQECDDALVYCIENSILKATDFEPVLRALVDQKPCLPVKKTDQNEQDKSRYKVNPQTSNISDYKQILN